MSDSNGHDGLREAVKTLAAEFAQGDHWAIHRHRASQRLLALLAEHPATPTEETAEVADEDREALADSMGRARLPDGYPLRMSGYERRLAADAVLASDWLRDHDAALTANAKAEAHEAGYWIGYGEGKEEAETRDLNFDTLTDERDAAKAEADDLRARLAKVEALHPKIENPRHGCCAPPKLCTGHAPECGGRDHGMNRPAWPCKTLRAALANPDVAKEASDDE